MKVIQPRTFNPRQTLFLGGLILLLIVIMIRRNPNGPEHIHWAGRTMGTHYDIKIADAPYSLADSRRLRLEVEQYLRRINQQMSLYMEDSEIRRFNRHAGTARFSVSPSFAAVTHEALIWAKRTGGAFDPTLDPLINLWGFGHEDTTREPPTQKEINAVLEATGSRLVAVPKDAHIQKARIDVQLNLNAMAKGYAADGVADLIRQSGATNYYVEIGGDLVVSGVNRDGVAWRIGVEEPDPEAAPGERLHGIAHLTRGALAGSGDYRRFRVDAEDRRYSHILDPRTGRPIEHDLASVNVWAPTCVSSDAIATALMVMGLEEGLSWIETEPEIEAIFFERKPDGTMEAFFSSGFRSVTAYEILPRLIP